MRKIIRACFGTLFLLVGSSVAAQTDAGVALDEALLGIKPGITVNEAKEKWPWAECSPPVSNRVYCEAAGGVQETWLGHTKSTMFAAEMYTAPVEAVGPVSFVSVSYSNNRMLQVLISHLVALYGIPDTKRHRVGMMNDTHWKWVADGIECSVILHQGMNIAGEKLDDFSVMCGEPRSL